MHFRPFALESHEKIHQIAKDVIEVCSHNAETNRGIVDRNWVVQHTHSELVTLHEIVARKHDHHRIDGAVLQCGILCGGSALVMAHALRDDNSTDEPLVAIDSYVKSYSPMTSVFDDAYLEYRENLWQFRMEKNITSVMADTVQYLAHHWQQPLRVVFIDSMHHYEHTRNELNLILPHVLPGGWLILHDYFSDEPPADGVSRAANEVFATQDLSAWDFYRSDGLAIMRRHFAAATRTPPTEATKRGTSRSWMPTKTQ